MTATVIAAQPAVRRSHVGNRFVLADPCPAGRGGIVTVRSRRSMANTGAAEDVRRELHRICDMNLVFCVRERTGTHRVLANFAGPEPRAGRDAPVARVRRVS